MSRSGRALLRVPPYSPTVLDSFNRADSASSLGSADTGQLWAAHTGTWGISSNKAYLPTRSGDSIATVQSVVNVAVEADITWITAAEPGLVARFADTNNFYVCFFTSNSGRLWKRVAGTYTLIQQQSLGVTCISGTAYRLGLTCNGNSLTVTFNGATVISATDTSLPSNTRVGLRHNDAVTGVRWDNFEAVPA